jgi:hypothetical protein
MQRAPPYRQFTHPDGRSWNIRLNGSTVELQITNDGDTVERKRKFDAPVLGARDLDDAVKEQLAEGFVEHTPPEWRRRLDELVSFWEIDDPGFDADVLRGHLLENGGAFAKQTVDTLTWWETGQPRDPNSARTWLKANLDQVIAGVCLAMRWPDAQVLVNVDAFLAEVKRPEVLEALLSVVEHPTASDEDGGPEARPSRMPLLALKALGKPDSDTALRLIRALDSDDERVRDVSSAILAEYSTDDGLFAALWDHRTVARKSDGMCWAMMRAAEIRRSAELRDFLQFMIKSPRFRAPGYPERLKDALAKLKNR